jgi:hypothetical protein
MKRNDVALIILASVGSVLVAYFLGNSLFGDMNERQETVPTFTVINPDLVEPRSDVFNEDAINPTVEIEVGRQTENSQDTDE